MNLEYQTFDKSSLICSLHTLELAFQDFFTQTITIKNIIDTVERLPLPISGLIIRQSDIPLIKSNLL